MEITKILLSVRYGNLSGDWRNKVYFQMFGRPSGKFNKCPKLSLWRVRTVDF